MKKFFAIFCAVMSLLLPVQASAGATLTVKVTDPAGQETTLSFSADELLALEQTTVVTDNDYVDGLSTFVGPRLSTLLESVDLKPDDQIFATALNDYRASIPAEEVKNYDVIVAVLMNGEEMSVRDKGPFWIIYPMTDHPELQDPIYNDRLIWQLASIELDLAD